MGFSLQKRSFKLSTQALGGKAASPVIFVELKGKVGQGKKEASVITKSACKMDEAEQQVK